VGPASASFTASPSPTTIGSSIAFNAGGSTDPGTTLSSYTWTFGDGNTGNGVTPSHSYAKAGTYIVTLTVGDAFGQTSTVAHAATVVGPPTAAFTAVPTPAIAGSPTSFDATTSTDPGTVITSYGWSFGDGSTGSGATPSHAFSSAGTYTVTLTVADNFGEQSAVTRSISVVGPLAASFTVTPNPGTAGSPVNFDAGPSTDPGTTISSYSWDFGDGATATGVASTHTYKKAGTYTVTITAADAAGQSVKSTQKVAIKPRLSGKLTLRRTQHRAGVLKHGLVVSVSLSEDATALFQIVRQTHPHGKPKTVTVSRSSRKLKGGTNRTTLKLNGRKLPSSGPVALTVRVLLTDASGHRVTVSASVTLT
jgi:PKD repeat protein